MSSPEPDNPLDGLLGTFGDLIGGDNAVVVSKDSENVKLHKVIDDCVYGLLSQESLTPQQVALLAALLQTR